jgi:hypothetical protein
MILNELILFAHGLICTIKSTGGGSVGGGVCRPGPGPLPVAGRPSHKSQQEGLLCRDGDTRPRAGSESGMPNGTAAFLMHNNTLAIQKLCNAAFQ